MKIIAVFNPAVDIEQVVPGQSISVRESVMSGVVLPAAKESFYNMLDDLDKVGKRVNDIFDALDNAKILNKEMSTQQEKPAE